MKRAWITLAPMLAAAALALWGGERLARRTVEDRVPADRVRLFDFSAAFHGELDRLSDLYQEHLAALATRTLQGASEAGLARTSENLIGIRTVYLFSGGKKTRELQGARPAVGATLRIPPVELDDGGRSLHPRQAVLLTREILEPRQEGSGWLNSRDGSHRVYWQRDDIGQCCAVVIDYDELQDCLQKHLQVWLAPLFKPLQEADQRVAIQGPGNRPLNAAAPSATAQEDATTGPSALVIPHRTALGEWQVLARDRLSVRHEHDTATLLVASALACSLLLAGIFLQIQQGRALKLAENRVSFVNRVSHELGTPLTNILLNLELASRALEARPHDSRRRLKLVDEEVRRLSRLVANVLTFSRGERKTLELRPRACVPDQVIDEVLRQFEPSLERSGIRVERQGEAAATLQLDPDALFQIVANLLSNVEKYAASGRWIGLEIALADQRLRIRVNDAGPGIPARERERVFEAFERVSSRVDEGVSGTGLGLAIARDLARRMGGELRLLPATRSGSGCAFELELPAPGSGSSSPATPQLTVLPPDESSAA